MPLEQASISIDIQRFHLPCSIAIHKYSQGSKTSVASLIIKAS